MNSQDDKDNELQRRERELQERENAIRLRELEDEINRTQPPLHRTAKHQAEKSGKLWQKKLVVAGKFFALVAVTVITIKIAAWLAGAVIVGTIAWVGYKLFFDSESK